VKSSRGGCSISPAVWEDAAMVIEGCGRARREILAQRRQCDDRASQRLELEASTSFGNDRLQV